MYHCRLEEQVRIAQKEYDTKKKQVRASFVETTSFVIISLVFCHSNPTQVRININSLQLSKNVQLNVCYGVMDPSLHLLKTPNNLISTNSEMLLYLLYLQLDQAYCELNKRITEHDESKNLGFDRPDITLKVGQPSSPVVQPIVYYNTVIFQTIYYDSVIFQTIYYDSVIFQTIYYDSVIFQTTHVYLDSVVFQTVLR